MLTFIKTNYRAGDLIEIHSSAGTFIGTIEYATDSFIVLRQPNDKVCGIAARDVLSFTADLPQRADRCEVTASAVPAGETASPDGEVPSAAAADTLTEADEAAEAETAACPLASQPLPAPDSPLPAAATDAPADCPDAPAGAADTLTEEKASDGPLTGEAGDIDFLSLLDENRPKIKVLGHIDLDKVDPNRKAIFKKKNKEAEAKAAPVTEPSQPAPAERPAETQAEKQPDEPAEADEPAPKTEEAKPPTPCRRTKVRACGRVVAYNKEKHYGYIHDFNGNGVLHFVQNNVVDPELQDKLEFNTKLTYSIETRPRGKEAVCIHKPMLLKQIMRLAETYIDTNQLQTALTLAEHILEANPDFVDAQAMAEDMRKGIAIHQRQAERKKKVHIPQKAKDFTQFLKQPKVSEYARGKEAYLAKQYEEAEAHYLQAISQGEKAESCVKDLLTLTITRFKKAGSPEQKQALADHARELFDRLQNYLPETLTNKQFIAVNYLLPLEAYEQFLVAVDEIMLDPAVAESPVRMGFYLWQKAIAYNKLGMVDDALAMIEEGLELAPGSKHLINLKNNIYNPHTGKRVKELPAVAIAPSALSVTNPLPQAANPTEPGTGGEKVEEAAEVPAAEAENAPADTAAEERTDAAQTAAGDSAEAAAEAPAEAASMPEEHAASEDSPTIG